VIGEYTSGAHVGTGFYRGQVSTCDVPDGQQLGHAETVEVASPDETPSTQPSGLGVLLSGTAKNGDGEGQDHGHGSMWAGEFVGGRLHGFGVQRLPDGSVAYAGRHVATF
jgi:hypothetical protein